jgi:hypothetical protein
MNTTGSQSSSSTTTHTGPAIQQGTLNGAGSGPSVSLHGCEVENEYAGRKLTCTKISDSKPQNVSKGDVQISLDLQAETASLYSSLSFFFKSLEVSQNTFKKEKYPKPKYTKNNPIFIVGTF